MQTEIVFPCPDGFSMPAALTDAEPRADRPRPGLVMVYEAFGMTAEMRRVARDLAGHGWTVLVPDLFARPGPFCVARTFRDMLRGTGPAVDDLEAARSWLAAHPAVDGDRLGAVGFCMGGGFALVLAGSGRYRASAPFYGKVPRELATSCPVVASYGARDRTLTRDPATLTRTLTELGVPHDVRVYPEAGHSFMTHGDGGVLARLAAGPPTHAGFHGPSAEDATARVVAFFREHLDGE